MPNPISPHITAFDCWDPVGLAGAGTDVFMKEHKKIYFKLHTSNDAKFGDTNSLLNKTDETTSFIPP